MSINSYQTEVIPTEDTIKCTALPVAEQTEYGVTVKQKSFIQSIPERIPVFGLLCCLTSELVFSFSSLIVKLLTDMHPVEILVFRSIFQLIPYVIITVKEKYPIFGVTGYRIHLALRSVTGSVSMICQSMSFRLMPLSDASTLFMTSPVFVTIFAYFLLKDPITIIHIVSGVLTILGVFIISKPEFIFGRNEIDNIYDHRMLGITLSLVAAVCAAISLINLRKLKTTPVSIVVVWFTLTSMIIECITLPILDKWVMPSGVYAWLMLLGIGMVGILYQFLLTTALKYESPGPISLTQTFNIVLAFIWGMVIFHEPVEWTSILGACLVSSCIIMIALVKCYNENPEKFLKFYKCVINFFCHKKNEQNLESNK